VAGCEMHASGVKTPFVKGCRSAGINPRPTAPGHLRWGNLPSGRTACGGENEGFRIPSLRAATPRTKSCPFTPLSKDRLPHPNEQQSLLIGTRATRRPKKQSESVSFPPRSPKARDTLRRCSGQAFDFPQYRLSTPRTKPVRGDPGSGAPRFSC